MRERDGGALGPNRLKKERQSRGRASRLRSYPPNRVLWFMLCSRRNVRVLFAIEVSPKNDQGRTIKAFSKWPIRGVLSSVEGGGNGSQNREIHKVSSIAGAYPPPYCSQKGGGVLDHVRTALPFM